MPLTIASTSPDHAQPENTPVNVTVIDTPASGNSEVLYSHEKIQSDFMTLRTQHLRDMQSSATSRPKCSRLENARTSAKAMSVTPLKSNGKCTATLSVKASKAPKVKLSILSRIQVVRKKRL